MKVLFVASECAPIVKVGGLADVVGGLPKALKKSGIDVSIVIPRYESVDESKYQSVVYKKFNVDYDNEKYPVIVHEGFLPGGSEIPVYFFENQKYLSIGNVYGLRSAEGSDLDIERFSFFSKAVSLFVKDMFRPGEIIIHCHDWHTAWIPLVLKSLQLDYQTILTIHNMGKLYQGWADEMVSGKLSVSFGVVYEPDGKINILTQGIIHADLISTVSPTYANEITTPVYGEGLDRLICENKNKLTGILNGIDEEVFNPKTDKAIAVNYCVKNDIDWINTVRLAKTANKIELGKKTNLKVDKNIPLFGMVGRVVEQKGMDILIPGLDSFLSKHICQVIILGTGEKKYENMLSELEKKHPEKIRFITRFDEVLAHLIYASADFFLIPSRFEPSGLTQLISMKYGSVPIVRKTGGLADSVIDKEYGIVFSDYQDAALVKALEIAEQCFSLQGVAVDGYNFLQMEKNAMLKNFSWEKQAGEYIELYKKLFK